MGRKTTTSLQQVAEFKQEKNKQSSTNSYNVLFGADAWKSTDTIEKYMEKNLPETKGLKRHILLLNVYRGIRVTNIDEKADAYFNYNLFKNGDFIYNFAIFSDDPVLIPGNQQLLDDIISTVKFY